MKACYFGSVKVAEGKNFLIDRGMTLDQFVEDGEYDAVIALRRDARGVEKGNDALVRGLFEKKQDRSPQLPSKHLGKRVHYCGNADL